MISIIIWFIITSFLISGLYGGFNTYRAHCLELAYQMRESAFNIARDKRYKEAESILHELELVHLFDHRDALMWRRSMTSIYSAELCNLMQWK